jgi:acetyl coenzyme A synthetase (ADP forming)-like protein
LLCRRSRFEDCGRRGEEGDQTFVADTISDFLTRSQANDDRNSRRDGLPWTKRVTNQSMTDTLVGHGQHEALETLARPGLGSRIAPHTNAGHGAPGHLGHQVLANILEYHFTGTVYPVNPNARAICSVRCSPTIADVPEIADVAVIVVPKDRVLEAAEQCGAAGVRNLVVISAGFREVGADGAAREDRLREIVRRSGMRLVGPNCMGIINTNPDVSLNATFAPVMPPHGRAAFVSQSGALGLSVLDHAREYGIGISQFVSVGNKADVSGNDLLEEWERDASVGVILMYVESFGNPRRFLEIASRITRQKPIIAVKSGRSRAGARAASSHTGALAASDVAVEALLAQAGVLRAGTVEELFDMAIAFDVRSLPRSRRTAVLTNAGGPGILAADAIEAFGLELVELSDETTRKLAPLFPAEASIRNPLDMIASATPRGYRTALEALLRDPNADAIVPIFVPPLGVKQEDVVGAIVDAARTVPGKPLLGVLMGREGLPAGRAQLLEAGIPTYVFPESAARALAVLNRQREWMTQPVPAPVHLDGSQETAAAILFAARTEQRDRLSTLEALSLLVAYGIPVAPARAATDVNAAVAAAIDLGFPVAMKIVSADVVHKSDIGGVELDIRNPAEARQAYAQLVAKVQERAPSARITGVLVQRMATVEGGRETIAGIARDHDFGPLIMFGLGGIYVEALRDVVFRIAPIDERQAACMLDLLRGAAALGTHRGHAAVDRLALTSVLQRLSQLALDFPEVAELDINPLIAHAGGVIAVDARVLLTK